MLVVDGVGEFIGIWGIVNLAVKRLVYSWEKGFDRD